MFLMTAIWIRLAVAVFVTGSLAAIVVPLAIHFLRGSAADLEVELPSLAVMLFDAPWLGAVPGLLALLCGIGALGLRPARVPLLLLGAVCNAIALGLLLVLLMTVLAPLYRYESL